MNCTLIWLLFENALTSFRFCHYFYWHLKACLDDPTFGYRCRVYMNALVKLCGKSVDTMFKKQEKICSDLTKICHEIRSAKDSSRQSLLNNKLEEINHYLELNPISIPLSPAMQVNGIDISQCSYFNSNSLPLKVVFKSAPSYNLPPPQDMLQASLSEKRRLFNKVIFKCGDDLRQDMLVMQIVTIINRIWLRAGYDLRLITFGVMNSADRIGMIELVSRARTLRQIHTEYGVTGSFKSHTIDTWLKKQNPSSFDYLAAVENFIHSCAGYLVMTYLLGICDRHNDNIMVTTNGYLFHIDFGKFLGDSQMMAGFKRDRTPFVFTADMLYVINSGDKSSKNYHFFVDQCCNCFSLVRQHGNFLLSLLSFMIPSNIYGLAPETVKYFHDALMTHLSDAQAKEHLNRLIMKASNSSSTKLNFLMHNIAQLKFSTNKEDSALYSVTNFDAQQTNSYSSGGVNNVGLQAVDNDELNSLEELTFCEFSFTKYRSFQSSDGRITAVTIDSSHKDPHKVIFYKTIVTRGRLQETVYRSYKEFSELSDKLTACFKMANIAALGKGSNKSSSKDVTEFRKQQIQEFINSVFRLSAEIAHSDIVYTFFHQIGRDHEMFEGEKYHHEQNNHLNQSLYSVNVRGQIKLSISYSDSQLTVFVQHAKNLVSPRTAEPDTYVKLYLLPDESKNTKRKTRTVSKSSCPSFIENIVYKNIPRDVFYNHGRHMCTSLEVSVWERDISGNSCLGKTVIRLPMLNLLKKKTIEDWYPLS